MKMQVFQQWLQQPDIQQKAQQDPALQERIQNYMQQRQMQITQKQNAQIGKLGAAPTRNSGKPLKQKRHRKGHILCQW